MNRRRPLAALLMSAATVAALAVPAGAATTSKVTWSKQTLPCATGHKSATITMKWLGPAGSGVVQKGWYDNPCPHQWLSIDWTFADSESNGGSFAVAPHHKGRWDEYMDGTLVYPGS